MEIFPAEKVLKKEEEDGGNPERDCKATPAQLEDEILLLLSISHHSLESEQRREADSAFHRSSFTIISPSVIRRRQERSLRTEEQEEPFALFHIMNVFLTGHHVRILLDCPSRNFHLLL